MSDSIFSEFRFCNKGLRNSLSNIGEWSKEMEDKYTSLMILVESLNRANYKKEHKIQRLKHKLRKYKKRAQKASSSHSSSIPFLRKEERKGQPQSHVVIIKECIDLTTGQEEEYDEAVEEGAMEIIVKKEFIDEEEEMEDENIVMNITETELSVIQTEEEAFDGDDFDMEPMLELEMDDEISEYEEEVVEDDPSPEPMPEKETEDVVVVEEVVGEEVVEEEVVEEEVVEEEELYEREINGKAYYVSNETDGPIYSITKDEEPGEVVGKYVKGKPVFEKSSIALPVPEPEEEEEIEVDYIQIKINKAEYIVEENNRVDGPIYAVAFDGDVGEQVGKYINGKPSFFPKK